MSQAKAVVDSPFEFFHAPDIPLSYLYAKRWVAQSTPLIEEIKTVSGGRIAADF